MTDERLKSNLNISKRKKTVKKTKEINISRKNANKEKCEDANIIFGLDNGATGTISSIVKFPDNSFKIFFQKTPSFITLDYQQSIQHIARIDWKKLKNWFENILNEIKNDYNKKYNVDINLKPLIILERPMINADRFKQSKNAARAFEATLIVLELINLENNYIIIDSKKWQHHFFGKNTILMDLKDESKKLGIEFLKSFKDKKYDNFIDLMKHHGDADSLLICKYAFEKLCK